MFITSAAYGAKTKRGSMMRVEVWGGAGEYGRSCYFVKNKETKILFDCGINRSYEDSYPKIEREVVPFLDAVFLSHIHEDHTMGLPLLAKYGYKKKYGQLVIRRSNSQFTMKNGETTIWRKDGMYLIPTKM